MVHKSKHELLSVLLAPKPIGRHDLLHIRLDHLRASPARLVGLLDELHVSTEETTSSV